MLDEHFDDDLRRSRQIDLTRGANDPVPSEPWSARRRQSGAGCERDTRANSPCRPVGLGGNPGKFQGVLHARDRARRRPVGR